MRYHVSLPENSIDSFHMLSDRPEEKWFCTSDPEGKKIGSGGGTDSLLTKAWKRDNSTSLALQNKVNDQKNIWTRNVKPHPAMVIQNSAMGRKSWIISK